VKELEIIRREASAIEDSTVFYVLRLMNLKRVSSSQIKTVKLFLALRRYGMNIVSTNLFLALYGKTRAACLSILHLLGDKGVLTWVRQRKNGPLRYMLSEKFLKLWNSYIEQQNLNKSSNIT